VFLLTIRRAAAAAAAAEAIGGRIIQGETLKQPIFKVLCHKIKN